MSGNDSFTKSLLHLEGTNAATTFPDVNIGGSAHTWAAGGNAQISTAQSKFGTASALFDGSGDALTVDGSSDFAFGTGDFTIDFWVRIASAAADYFLYDARPNATQGLYPAIYMQSGVVYFHTNSAAQISGGSVSANTWTHIAVARSGTSTKLFVGGTQVGSTYSDSNNYLNGGGIRPFLGIASFDSSSFPYNGYIDEFRVSKGVARWTANFTPPTISYGPADLTASAGSYVLTGIATVLSAGKGMIAATGSYVLTGVAATLTYAIHFFRVTAATGSYALTGVAATLRSARSFAALAGSYTLTGVAASLRAGKRIAAATGSYVLTGITLIEAYLPVDVSKFFIRRTKYVLQKLRTSDPNLDQ